MPGELVFASVINGVFALLGIIVLARQNSKLKHVAADAKATRTQVENGHDRNLREEADDRHEENVGKLDTLILEVQRLGRSVGRLWERSDEHTDQLHELGELTGPRSRFEPPSTPKHRR